MGNKKHKQAHSIVPRGKRVLVVLKDGNRFVDKFIERRPHELVFEGRTEQRANIESMTIYRVPPHVQRACEGKIDYKSEPTARAAVTRMSAKKGERFDAYECELCGGWHIGHSIQPINLEFKDMPSAAELAKALKGTGVDPKMVMSKIKGALKKRR
jgi:hypothetical protein